MPPLSFLGFRWRVEQLNFDVDLKFDGMGKSPIVQPPNVINAWAL